MTEEMHEEANIMCNISEALSYDKTEKIEELQEVVREQESRITEQTSQIAKMEEEIAELRQQLEIARKN